MVRSIDSHKRWLAPYVLCLGVLMIVLDTTIVNVALPSIREDLGFTETSLVWIVNAYMLTFGGLLLIGCRLGDYYQFQERLALPAMQLLRQHRSPIPSPALPLKGRGKNRVDLSAFSKNVTFLPAQSLLPLQGEGRDGDGVASFQSFDAAHPSPFRSPP